MSSVLNWRIYVRFLFKLENYGAVLFKLEIMLGSFC